MRVRIAVVIRSVFIGVASMQCRYRTSGIPELPGGIDARSRYCFIRFATAYGSSRLHAPERGSARSPTRGWPATSGGQHRQAPRRRAEDSSEALGNSAEALGNSGRGDRCTGAQTDPGNGASVTFSVSITFSASALRPTTSRSAQHPDSVAERTDYVCAFGGIRTEYALTASLGRF